MRVLIQHERSFRTGAWPHMDLRHDDLWLFIDERSLDAPDEIASGSLRATPHMYDVETLFVTAGNSRERYPC